MKALVIGAGSIGMRHLCNLRAIRVPELAVAEPDGASRAEAVGRSGAQGFATVDEGLSWRPDVVVVASPTDLHIAHALAAARAGCHLLIEKPLGVTMDGAADLIAEIDRGGLVSLVGCNMRWHPGPTSVRELLARGAIGDIYFARLHFGQFLPAWRPDRDHRRSYSASAVRGGGCLLDCIHEIDLSSWLLGPATDVICTARRLSDVTADAEDLAILVCNHVGGAVSEIHLDLLQRTYERGCQVVGETGTIFWDFTAGCTRWYESSQNRWHVTPQPAAWSPNQMYLEELRHFLACVERREPTVQPVPAAAVVLQVALAAKESARLGCRVPTGGNTSWQ